VRPAAESEVIRFGVFEVDLRAGELRRNSHQIKLQEQPFRTLVLLLKASGQVVTREDLRRQLWPEDTFVDFDHSISSAINRVREALGDSAERPRYVQTVARGYRWIAPIAPGNGLSASNSPLQPELPDEAVKTRQFARKTILLFCAGCSLILLAAVGFMRWRERGRGEIPIRSVAVLPLQNLTGNPEQDYLTEGMTDELITDLAKLGTVRVISRTSVVRYGGTQKSLPEIARELNVDAIVEGTVTESPGHIHVSAQLVQAQPEKLEKHLWAESYDRPTQDLVALQEELCREIAGAVRSSIAPQESAKLRHRNVSPEAYRLFLKGRYFWNRRTGEGFEHAIDYFDQAIAKQPDYAEAYTGLADSYLLLSGYYMEPQNRSIPKARTAAQKALELDSSLAEPHASLGMIAMNYDWNWAEAERQYRQAIALNPNYATAHHWYAEYLASMGRFDEGLAEIQVAEQLDPLSLIISSDHGKILFLARRYDRAIAQNRKTLEMDPNFVLAHSWLAVAELQKGLFSDGIAELEKNRASDDSLFSSAWLVYAYAAAGRRAEAQKAVEELRHLTSNRNVDSGLMVVGYIGLGDKEQAFAWLDREYAERSVGLTSLKVNPLYDPLRSDPRFQDLMRRVGLAQ